MLIVSYDISDNKVKTKFSKFLKKYGHQLQYSVYEIENSDRILDNVIFEIKVHFEDKFTEADSVFIFDMRRKKVYRYGYALNEGNDLKMNS